MDKPTLAISRNHIALVVPGEPTAWWFCYERDTGTFTVKDDYNIVNFAGWCNITRPVYGNFSSYLNAVRRATRDLTMVYGKASPTQLYGFMTWGDIPTGTVKCVITYGSVRRVFLHDKLEEEKGSNTAPLLWSIETMLEQLSDNLGEFND